MSVENLNWKDYINEQALVIESVKEGERYFMINDVKKPSADLFGIVVPQTDGKEYPRGLQVIYEVTRKSVDLFPGVNVTDPNIESSTHQKLYNIKHKIPRSGSMSRRSHKNKSKSPSRSKSKKGGSRKSKKGGRR
jgi:hypothetical protein